ncbi:unnamed protein product [Timema podura]|uniref:WD repeat-containing protein 55 homolog n=1 Tax=Timema podura TaxID=61482 RepID=A0ABN7NW34_TIMPD|nr:unnamed protein product [Timema podura]
MDMNTGTNSSDSDSDISITDSEDEEIENTDSKVDTAEGPSGNTAEGHDDADDEDDLIKAIRHEKEKPRDQPPDIPCEDFVVDISFHPLENIIAAATITGDVILHSYTNESTEIKETLELHTRACRDIEFNEDGNLLFSSSKDKCIMVTDTRTGKLKRMFNDAHENILYYTHWSTHSSQALCTLPILEIEMTKQDATQFQISSIGESRLFTEQALLHTCPA